MTIDWSAIVELETAVVAANEEISDAEFSRRWLETRGPVGLCLCPTDPTQEPRDPILEVVD